MLINNAGVVSGKPILETTDDEVLQTMAVNTLAPFWTVKAFLPSMKERKSGHIVNIGSVLGTAAQIAQPRTHTHIRTLCLPLPCLDRNLWWRAADGLLGEQVRGVWIHRVSAAGAQERRKPHLHHPHLPLPHRHRYATSSSSSSLSLTDAYGPTWNAKACSRG